jgi:hypothetical protein
MKLVVSEVIENILEGIVNPTLKYFILMWTNQELRCILYQLKDT